MRYLDDSSLADDFEDLTFTDGTITENDVDDFSVSREELRKKGREEMNLLGEFDVIEDD